jgi:maleate isomerase
MTDSLGWRRKFGVMAPFTNTSVQSGFDVTRPRGVALRQNSIQDRVQGFGALLEKH